MMAFRGDETDVDCGGSCDPCGVWRVIKAACVAGLGR